MSTLPRLGADVDACLAFLVAHQDEWRPVTTVYDTGGHAVSVRTHLVAVLAPVDVLTEHVLS